MGTLIYSCSVRHRESHLGLQLASERGQSWGVRTSAMTPPFLLELMGWFLIVG